MGFPRGDLVRVPLGGIDQRHKTPGQENGKSDYVENMRLDPNGGWVSCGGFEPYDGGLGATERVRSIHWFAQHGGGRSWVVFEVETGTEGFVDLKYVQPGMGSANTVRGMRGGKVGAQDRVVPPGPSRPTQYLDHGNWVYLISAYNAPVRWSGRRLEAVGFSGPPSAPEVADGYERDEAYTNYLYGSFDGPTVAPNWYYSVHGQRGLASATTTVLAWRYGWAVTWVNDLGQESPLSEVVWKTGYNEAYHPGDGVLDPLGSHASAWDGTHSHTGRVSVLLTMPRPPEHVRGIRLWRTTNMMVLKAKGAFNDGATSVYEELGGAVPVFFHSEWPAGDEFHYYDDKPDAELGDAFDRNTGVWPAGASMAAKHKNTLFLAGMGSEPQTVRFSAPFFLEQFPPGNYLYGGGGKGGRITAIKASRSAVAVFRRNGIDVIRGTPASGFTIETLTDEVGHVGGPVVDIPNLGLMYLYDDGPWLLVLSEGEHERTQWHYIGAEIRTNWVERVNLNAIEAGVGEVIPWHREVWLQLPGNGSTRLNQGFVFHYDTGVWSMRQGYPIACMSVIRDHRHLLVFGSYDVSIPGIYVQHDGADFLESSDADPIESIYRCSLDLVYRSRVLRAEVHVVSHGREVTVKHRVDRQPPKTTAKADITVLAVDTEYARAFWDTPTSVWGTAFAFEAYSTSILRIDLHQVNCLEFQLEITGTRLHITGIDLFVDRPTDLPKIAP